MYLKEYCATQKKTQLYNLSWAPGLAVGKADAVCAICELEKCFQPSLALYEHVKKTREKSWILWKIFVAFCRRI